jgi:hypothetical protein
MGVTASSQNARHSGEVDHLGQTWLDHHAGGGAYGATTGGAPYVTGAVAHGSHTGAGGGHGGGQAATGAGLGRHQLQQPQPALLTANTETLQTSNNLFIASVSLQETNPSTVITASERRVFMCKQRRGSKQKSPLNNTRLHVMCKRT